VSTHMTWRDFGLPPGLDGRDVLAATASRSGAKTAITAQRGRRRIWRPRAPLGDSAEGAPRAFRSLGR
jgi:hypothetical protein